MTLHGVIAGMPPHGHRPPTDWRRLAVLQTERAWLATELERSHIQRTSEHKLAVRLYDINKAITEGIGE